jgi:hypothetical protein
MFKKGYWYYGIIVTIYIRLMQAAQVHYRLLGKHTASMQL